jgi:hypothetical protein
LEGQCLFAYGSSAWLFVGLWMALLIGFALAAWRLMNDRLLAGLVLQGIPLFAFVSLAAIPLRAGRDQRQDARASRRAKNANDRAAASMIAS